MAKLWSCSATGGPPKASLAAGEALAYEECTANLLDLTTEGPLLVLGFASAPRQMARSALQVVEAFTMHPWCL
eukprot:Skav229903  [mRNA]  locus=scaffold2151:473218:476290:+ [translate_table: standard]